MTDAFKMIAHSAKHLEHGDRNSGLIGLCALAGLRISEARAVRFSHFKCTTELTTLEVRGKGDKRRVVPISRELFAILTPRICATFTTDEIMYEVDDRTARAMITRVGRQVGLKRPISSHDLRMTFATHIYGQTKDIRLVQELLGHADTKTTTRYIEVPMDAMKSAVNFAVPVQEENHW